MNKEILESLYFLGKKAEFMRQKLLKLEGKVFSDKDIIVKETRDLIRSFNDVCDWGEIPGFVEGIGSDSCGRQCHKAEDLLYRVEAVIAIASAGDGLVGGGNVQQIIMPDSRQGGDYEERSQGFGG